MSNKCEVCSSGGKVVARGMCKPCYDKWYLVNKSNPDVVFRKTSRRKNSKNPKGDKPYPIAHIVTVWECSDGREFSSETDALRYELDIFRRG